jgi:hypothetical protein
MLSAKQYRSVRTLYAYLYLRKIMMLSKNTRLYLKVKRQVAADGYAGEAARLSRKWHPNNSAMRALWARRAAAASE